MYIFFFAFARQHHQSRPGQVRSGQHPSHGGPDSLVWTLAARKCEPLAARVGPSLARRAGLFIFGRSWLRDTQANSATSCFKGQTRLVGHRSATTSTGGSSHRHAPCCCCWVAVVCGPRLQIHRATPDPIHISLPSISRPDLALWSKVSPKTPCSGRIPSVP